MVTIPSSESEMILAQSLLVFFTGTIGAISSSYSITSSLDFNSLSMAGHFLK
jgi:hypothetical protein